MQCETIHPDGEAIAAQDLSAVRIGKVSIEIHHSVDEFFLGPELEQFRSAPGNCDVKVGVDWSAGMRKSGAAPDFDSGATWVLFRDENDFVFDFITSVVGPVPYKRMRASHDFRRAQITLNRELLSARPHPLEYPTDELLITNYLAHHGLGVEVHGCGVIDHEIGGLLFLGHSGAGKSTTARLWRSLRNAEILSDDRIILRLQDSELWMYGTPWHGEAQFAAANKSTVRRIFILQHGTRNKISPLSEAHAVGELFARSFPPFHSAEGLERAIEFLNRAIAAVPCYDFQFTPDFHGLDAVVGFHD